MPNFAERLLTRDNLAIEAYMINGSRNIELPANLTVSKLSPKAQNVARAYDELSSLPQPVFWALLLALIFLITVFVAEERELKMTKR